MVSPERAPGLMTTPGRLAPRVLPVTAGLMQRRLVAARVRPDIAAARRALLPEAADTPDRRDAVMLRVRRVRADILARLAATRRRDAATLLLRAVPPQRAAAIRLRHAVTPRRGLRAAVGA